MPVYQMEVTGQVQALAALSLGTELPCALEIVYAIINTGTQLLN
jgi:hypothetical protein